MPASFETDTWECRDESVEAVQQTMGVSVVSATRQYEDVATRRALVAASNGEYDAQVRFFAASNISFTPSLPLGITGKMIAPTIRQEAREEFVERLEAQNILAVREVEETERALDDDHRPHVTEYAAIHPLTRTSDRTLPLTCWIVVWMADGNARVVTAGHPAVTLATHLELADSGGLLDRSPDSYRDEFFEHVAGVQ